MARASGTGMAALQRAVYGVLNAGNIGARVYDDIPQSNTTFPVARLEVVPTEREDTFGRAGQNCSIEVHVFATYQGALQLGAVLDNVTRLLDGAQLLAVGWRVEDIAVLPQQQGEDEVIGGVKVQHRVANFYARLREGEQP
jgi:hypothetical protein